MNAERPRQSSLAPDHEVCFDAERDAEAGQELALLVELHVGREVGDPLALLQDDAIRVQGEQVPRATGAGDADGEERASRAMKMHTLQLERAAAGV